jgi:hypothetical protein
MNNNCVRIKMNLLVREPLNSDVKFERYGFSKILDLFLYKKSIFRIILSKTSDHGTAGTNLNKLRVYSARK